MAFCKGIPSGGQEFVSLCKSQIAENKHSLLPWSCINLKPHTSFLVCCMGEVKELKMPLTQRSACRDQLGLTTRIRGS